MNDAGDRRRVQQAALRVGAVVGIGSAVVLAGGVAILLAVLLAGARRDDAHEHGGGHGGGPGGDGDRFVIDVDHVLPWVVGLGLVGVLLLAIVAWLGARRAVRPLEGALRLQRTFVADASHELRTPLTALSSRVQLLQRRIARGEDPESTLAALREDVAVMDAVLPDMLLAAESGQSSETAVVSDAVTEAVRTATPLADDAGVVLGIRGAADQAAASGAVRARIPTVTLTRLCIALLDNAVQHTPRGSAVEISASAEGGRVAVRVTDAGSGIAPQDIDRIFERFARGHEAGRRRGFGLGLALVREAAAAVGGSIVVERTSPAGTTFLLTLPRG